MLKDSVIDDSTNEIQFMTSHEVAKLLNISKAQLMNLCSSGGVPYYKLGRRNRYLKKEIIAMVLKEKRGSYGNKNTK